LQCPDFRVRFPFDFRRRPLCNVAAHGMSFHLGVAKSDAILQAKERRPINPINPLAHFRRFVVSKTAVEISASAYRLW
jgi:hypothetical protein